MIRRTPELDALERRWLAQQPVSPQRNQAVFEAMYEYARQAGAYARRDPREGLNEVIELARKLHGLRRHR